MTKAIKDPFASGIASQIAMRRYGPDFGEFGDTNIVLEDLTIRSGGLAAYLVGRDNIIRHCRIEVEGHEAIALFGASTQLIDNEIVVKRSLHQCPSTALKGLGYESVNISPKEKYSFNTRDAFDNREHYLHDKYGNPLDQKLYQGTILPK